MEAIKWWRRADVGESYSARYELGVMYEQGVGVEQDYAEAARWWHKAVAASRGDGEAQFKLGNAYAAGKGVAQDYMEAVKWYTFATYDRNPDASYTLGVMYEEGRGVERDEMEALRLYRDAMAINEYPRALLALGRMYEKGIGTPRDETIAYMWYDLAVENGSDEAENLRDAVGERMEPPQIAKAKELSMTCTKHGYLPCFNQSTSVSIIEAVRAGDMSKLRSLVESSWVHVNVKNRDGNTALMLAAREGHERAVEILIEAEADINAKG